MNDKRKLRILIIKGFPKLTVELTLALELKSLGHTVEIAIPDYDETSMICKKNGIPLHIVRIRGSLFTNNFIYKRIYDILGIIDLVILYKKGNYDIVHLNLLRARVLGRIAHLFYNKSALISTIHGPDLENKNYRLLEKFTNWIEDLTISNSFATAFHIHSKKINPKNQSIIYNGINLEQCDQIIKDENYLKDELNLYNCNFVGLIAYLYPDNMKGHKEFIQASKIVKNIIPNTIFLIIGSDPYNIGTRENLENYSKELGVNNSIYFLGERHDVINIMDSLNCLVLPSNVDEGFGLVLIEAMSRNIPVIGSDRGAIPEIITDEVGRIFPAGNSVELSKCIIEILQNQKKAKILGENGRKRVELQFNSKIMTNKHLFCYKKLVTGKFKY